MQFASKRHVLGAASAAMLALAMGTVAVRAASGEGLLARLQAAKQVHVGVADQPPFSALNPDGSLTGVAPTMTKAVMERLGIAAIEGSIATYGQLIPGMLAGRWDFVAASMTITKARCQQVLFSDPLVLDGSEIVALKGTAGDFPNSFVGLSKLDAPVGTEQGGADFRGMVTAGIPLANIRQFPNDPAMMDGLVANRIKYAVIARSAMRAVMAQRKLDVKISYPVEDALPHGSGPVFRKQDVDLYAAYRRELRALKASGEFARIVRQFGFDVSPELLHDTAEHECAKN